MKTSWPVLSLWLLACGLVGGGALLLWLWQQPQVGASSVLVLLLILGMSWQLQRILSRQRQLPAQLFRALANGDASLGLPVGDPLRQSFEQARERIQQARLAAEQQAQFLRQVLLHTELALLICLDDGSVLEQSPAAARLLGVRLSTLAQLPASQQALAQLVTSANGYQKCTLPWVRGAQPDTLAVAISVVSIAGQPIRLVSLQSIHEPLNQREQQAYTRLIRVLTHEVANSVTPLSSMADSCQQLLPADLCFDSAEDKADLQLALSAISRRTTHLAQFIADFRAVAALPKPLLKPAPLGPLLTQVAQSFQAQCREQQVALDVQILDSRPVMHDAGQIEQVLINLLKNALEALQLPTASKLNQQIQLTLAPLDDQQLYLEVRDNGPGVTESAREMIFVPFFTTKAQGSGIGLALARQILLNHGGDLLCVPSADPAPQGACFRLLFG